MIKTLHYIHCDICGEPSDLMPYPPMNFEEALDYAVIRHGWHRVYSKTLERTPEKHVCSNCWEFRPEDVEVLRA